MSPKGPADHPPRIVVVGSCNTDFVVRSRRIPSPGETVLGGDFFRAAGGKGANQAVAAARLGGEVTLVARVGADELGRAAVESYSAAGINTDHIGTDPEAASGVALIVLSETGENAITVAPGANANLSVADVEAAAAPLRRADVALLQLETPVPCATRAIELTREGSARVILNPAPAARLEADLLSRVDVLTPNASEAAALAGFLRPAGRGRPPDVERDTSDLLAAGAGTVIVTLGADGVAVGRGDEFLRFPARRVEPVDTTGAGDAFNGALAVALAEGRELFDAIDFAQGAAALSVLREGAQPSLPRRADLDRSDPA